MNRLRHALDRVPVWGLDLTGVSLAALAAAACGVLFIKPTFDARARAADVLSANLLVDAEGDRVRGELRAARAQAAAAREELASLRVDLAPITDLNTRLGALAKLAQAGSVELTQIEPATDRATLGPGGAFRRVPIRLAGAADDARVEQFLRTLHEQAPDLAVVALRIQAPESRLTQPGETSQNRAAFTIDLIWHALGTTPASSSAAGASPASPPAASPVSQP